MKKIGNALLSWVLLLILFGVNMPLSVKAADVFSNEESKEIIWEDGFYCIVSESEDISADLDLRDVEPYKKTTKKYYYTYHYSDGSYMGKLTVSLTGYYATSGTPYSYISSVSKSYTGAGGFTFTSSKSGNTATVTRNGTGGPLTYHFSLSTAGVWSHY